MSELRDICEAINAEQAPFFADLARKEQRVKRASSGYQIGYLSKIIPKSYWAFGSWWK